MKKYEFLLLLLAITCMHSCSKSGNGDGTPTSSLQITSIDPTSGTAGTVVTITGIGFGPLASDNLVSFNGKTAIVSGASPTKLVVTDPPNSVTGKVTITFKGITATGPVFTHIPTILVGTFAGSPTAGFADGMGTTAKFSFPYRAATDAQGNVYVVDVRNSSIRKITPAGLVSTLAGNGAGGYVDGPGTTAEFNKPTDVAVDGSGNVYVADWANHRIRKITPAGLVSTLAGNGNSGLVDGNGTNAEFINPYGVTADPQGNIYVADYFCIRKITPAGLVSTMAGSKLSGFADGNGDYARFMSAVGVAADSLGNVYVTDYSNARIRKVDPSGTVSTLAGNGIFGYVDGTGTAAELDGVYGIGVDALGNVYMADRGSQRIRMISKTGVVSTLAGNGVTGYVDGPAANAEFNYPYGVAPDPFGNVYVPDSQNNCIRKITIQ